MSNTLDLMKKRLGDIDPPTYSNNVEHMAAQLNSLGGYAQQNRMIRDKRYSLDQATKYSYQGAWVKKYEPNSVEEEGETTTSPVRALINPNKLKQDYDDKIISVGFEFGFKCGDVFQWCNTNTYWLIYLQDLTELAYFRGDIRKCSFKIEWLDSDKEKKSTYAAIRGPVETTINYVQKHTISIDDPNYSLNILMPKNEDTVKYFTRYSKFYLSDSTTLSKVCWRVEAVDAFSSDGILEINAVEYYANETEDNIEEGLVGDLIVEPVDPNPTSTTGFSITGETFIKPKKEYVYYIDSSLSGNWYTSDNVPVKITVFTDSEGHNAVKVKWTSSYSGQFDLWYGDDTGPLFDYKKTIVVESLF